MGEEADQKQGFPTTPEAGCEKGGKMYPEQTKSRVESSRSEKPIGAKPS